MSKKIALFLYLTIGAVGAIGQAFLLRHYLVNSYPYKMMGPFDPLYSRIGEMGMIVAPVSAIAAMIAFVRIKRILIPAVGVVVCPIVFWIVFTSFFWRSNYSAAQLAEPIFDRTSADLAAWMFLESAFSLLAEGLIIGLGCGVIIAMGEKLISKRASHGVPDLP